jgi:hypothetical protein
MNDAHLDRGGRVKNGWYCTWCESKIEDAVMDSYPSTLAPNFKQAKCHKCKKLKVIKLWKPAS